jgi:hypothetical protein
MAKPAPSARLHGRVVVVDAARADVALGVASDGATVVVTGDDAAAAGALSAQVAATGARTAVFTGDLATAGARAALAELLDELFGDRATPE